MVEPVKLSTLYDPQGKWTGPKGMEPTGAWRSETPEDQEAWFTPSKPTKLSGMYASHSGQWLGERGRNPSSGFMNPTPDWVIRGGGGSGGQPDMYIPRGTVTYRDIAPTAPPVPIQQVQNLIPGAATTAPVNQETLQQLAQEKANAQLTGNLFPTFNQPAVAPTIPAVAPTIPAVAPTTGVASAQY